MTVQQQSPESPTVTHLACVKIQGTQTQPEVHPKCRIKMAALILPLPTQATTEETTNTGTTDVMPLIIRVK